MKKKILIGAFLLLVFITIIVFVAAAIDSYNYDMDPANGVDLLEGVGAGIAIVLGGIAVLFELDLFFTVYYFLVKPKTVLKSIFIVLSHLLILLVFFSGDLAKFLSEYVSDTFREEIIVIIPIFFLYVISRIVCVTACFSQKDANRKV